MDHVKKALSDGAKATKQAVEKALGLHNITKDEEGYKDMVMKQINELVSHCQSLSVIVSH